MKRQLAIIMACGALLARVQGVEITLVNALTNYTLIFRETGDFAKDRYVGPSHSVVCEWDTNNAVEVIVADELLTYAEIGLPIDRGGGVVSVMEYGGSYSVAYAFNPETEQQSKNRTSAMDGAEKGLVVGAAFMLFFWVRRAWTIGDRQSVD